MAKLNEQPPAPPVENLDALKRRFIRQNREIARVNSNQSQRIRNLETEISRLVAENISLREQAISAHAEAERWRASNSVNREILDMRDRLQGKMDEVGELLGEMGRIPEKVARKGPRRKSRMTNVGERRSSATELEWRNRLSVREAMAEERAELVGGHLPAILEDKQYPRRTLENTELAALREQAALQEASESPELGPPPIAHFDVVGESAGLESARTSEDETAGEDIMQLPSNLERRRKRRTSALLQAIPAEELQEHVTEDEQANQALPEPATSSQHTLKSGAKRKLDVSELEESNVQQPSNQNDDFVFQRRSEPWKSAPAGVRIPSRFTRPPGRGIAPELQSESQSPEKTITVVRKILAPKSTNSPTKRRVNISEKPNVDVGEEPRPAVIKPSRRINPPSIEAVKVDRRRSERSQDNNLPPKTPAAEDEGLLSPTSTEFSARNTSLPKEAAILSSVEDVLNGSIGRGSRRARPAVSYALPNLRDKMRRPGKELVGAVEGLERGKENSIVARGASLDRANSDDVRTNDDQCRVSNIKQEADMNPEAEWKTLPTRKNEEAASPLRDKERKERPENSSHKSTGDLEKAVDQSSIFDPPVSSPTEAAEPPNVPQGGSKVQPSTRRKPSTSASTARRHSVQPATLANGHTPASSELSSDRRSSSSTARAPHPRPGSAAGTRSERMASMASEIKRSNTISSNPTSKEAGGGGAESALHARAERTLNRRRSMMV